MQLASESDLLLSLYSNANRIKDNPPMPIEKPPLLERLPAKYVGLVLLLIGSTGVWGGHRHWLQERWGLVGEIVSPIGEAFVVAGLLALFVDPFLKARLLREASRNIFEHMIGLTMSQNCETEYEK